MLVHCRGMNTWAERMKLRPCSIDLLSGSRHSFDTTSGALVFGDGSELANDFLETGTASGIGARGDGSRIFLGSITVIHIAKAGNFASKGDDVP